MGAIEDLAAELAKLPGIGRKTALRLTYYLLKQPPEQSRRLADVISGLAARIRRCSVCGSLTEGDPCAICSDPRRDQTVICVVEEASDISAIERAGEFRGVYHVLGGRLSPLDGIGPDDLTVRQLVSRVAHPDARTREVILATNPSLEGEATALYVQRQLEAGLANGGRPAITRIARGIPVGGDLEYADGVTIAQSLSARRAM